jgi:hypothetical protein
LTFAAWPTDFLRFRERHDGGGRAAAFCIGSRPAAAFMIAMQEFVVPKSILLPWTLLTSFSDSFRLMGQKIRV